ncbi:MAG TPA: multidrug effflux MFS transporter [Candidatus Acidoferrales bacterium]|jgi:DHA1 family bicyclomycin/chloramphenicol resistance-like MFS transporter|nr:multidrug effflux MFS transporter [Candidatus Acidoferrales bacterium]
MSQSHNRYLIIVILGALSTISPFAIDMYLPAFPEMATALHTTTARISLSLASYFAGLAAGQLFYGPLLDRFGRKLPLYAGLTLFIAASMACLCARSVEWLVALRFVQALGGCAAQVAAMAMVRDFFPARETAKIISLLILVISASPLLAPSVGVFVAVNWGWQWVFIVLSVFVVVMLAVSAWVLPEGHEPDKGVSMRPLPILRNYLEVLKEPQFITYSLAGAFAFSGLLVYVASSPIVFMEVFHVSAKQFSAIFAGLAVGFIGSNQINVFLLRKYTSEQIFLGTMLVECPVALLLLVGTIYGWFGLPATLVLLFIALSALGLSFPNAAALALVPFDHNIGSAAAMMGFLQIGVSGLASASIGIFDSHSMMPVALVLAATSWIGLGILFVGKRRIPALKYVEEKDCHQLPH